MDKGAHGTKVSINLVNFMKAGYKCGMMHYWEYINSSAPGQNGRYFAADIFRCIFMNEKFCIWIKMSLKFVPKGAIDINPALV